MSAADNKSFDDISKEQEQLKRQQEANKRERENLIERAREIEEEKKKAPIKLKTKPVPAVVTLTGGAAAAIVCFAERFDVRTGLIFILISLCIFLILGDVIKIMLDKIELPRPVEEDDNAVDSEGEMIEKGSVGDETLIEEGLNPEEEQEEEEPGTFS